MSRLGFSERAANAWVALPTARDRQGDVLAYSPGQEEVARKSLEQESVRQPAEGY